MHNISLEKYNIRTDLIIETELTNIGKKDVITNKNYQIERINQENDKYISISTENDPYSYLLLFLN